VLVGGGASISTGSLVNAGLPSLIQSFPQGSHWHVDAAQSAASVAGSSYTLFAFVVCTA
jgi:hypothetical protein